MGFNLAEYKREQYREVRAAAERVLAEDQSAAACIRRCLDAFGYNIQDRWLRTASQSAEDQTLPIILAEAHARTIHVWNPEREHVVRLYYGLEPREGFKPLFERQIGERIGRSRSTVNYWKLHLIGEIAKRVQHEAWEAHYNMITWDSGIY